MESWNWKTLEKHWKMLSQSMSEWILCKVMKTEQYVHVPHFLSFAGGLHQVHYHNFRWDSPHIQLYFAPHDHGQVDFKWLEKFGWMSIVCWCLVSMAFFFPPPSNSGKWKVYILESLTTHVTILLVTKVYVQRQFCRQFVAYCASWYVKSSRWETGINGDTVLKGFRFFFLKVWWIATWTKILSLIEELHCFYYF